MPRFSSRLLPVIDASVRLVPSVSGRSRYRPLTVGTAVLRRPDAGGPWVVRVGLDERLLPLAGVARGGVGGCGPVRRAWPLLAPEDLEAGVWWRRGQRGRPGRRADIYGWCLMYQPPGATGLALVDAADGSAELPAFFELPGEVIDRGMHLARHGIRSRALVLLAEPGDFVWEPEAGRVRNRFFPEMEH
jgi:hypothetical protein